MSFVLTLLFLAALVAFFVGIVNPALVHQSSRKQSMTVYGGASAIFFVLIGTTSPHVPIPASAPIVVATSTAPVATTTPVATSTPRVGVANLAEDDIPTVSDQAVAQVAIVKISTATQQAIAAPIGGKTGQAYLYPNPTLTPGAVLTTDASKLCTPGYSSSVRNVTTSTKKQVYAEYGLTYPQASGAYEADHFIPLEIGGSNDITNLWPEPASPVPGFHQKDQFENFEHEQICKGILTVQEAQSRMISDWYFYWQTEIEGVTTTNTVPIQSAPAPTPVSAPQPTTTTSSSSSAAYYTSSYDSSKYYYPASCLAWKSLSSEYLVSFTSLQTLLSKYPSQTLSPQCL